MLRSLLTVGVFLALSITGCAANPGTPDGSVGPDGSVVPTGPCGGAGGACCASRICELGLQCGRGDRCCVAPGSSAGCNAAADCCNGLACEGSRCCAPRTAACSASSDCCMGLVCAEGGTCEAPGDVDPLNPNCGMPGGTCCAGFSCRDEAVCDSTTGMCGACGQAGQECCDGASPCTASTLACELMRDASDVVTTQCVDTTDPSRACGDVDQPCCPGATTMPTDCSGGLNCVVSAGGSTCLMPTDTGMMGQPCGPRDSCNAGLVCDRRTNPSGACEMTPGDCGMDGMMCCDLGGSERTCSGGLHCQFNECGMCRGPSLTCLLGGVLPGQECCAGSACRPAPLIPRCCMGDGGSCENSLDCCGLMRCSDGMCSCSNEGSFCLDSSECCEGFVCDTFQCTAETTENMCKDSRESCTGSSECCSGLACSETRTEPSAPPVRQCCSGGGTACTGNEDCCGQMLCEDGECQCVMRAERCDRDIECCEGDICLVGSCQDGTGCEREGQTCNSAASNCCGQLSCRDHYRMTAGYCCVDQTFACLHNEDCCGNMTCDPELQVCVGVTEGMPCDTQLDCAEGLSCAESTPGSSRDWACRRPP